MWEMVVDYLGYVRCPLWDWMTGHYGKGLLPNVRYWYDFKQIIISDRIAAHLEIGLLPTVR